MTNNEFIEKVVSLYKTAKKSVEQFQQPSIKRGRNHSISSVVEDLLAYFILSSGGFEEHELWVDYPISYTSPSKITKTGQQGTKTIYTDIAIVKKVGGKNYIEHIIDLKMDLGWKRNLIPTIDNAITTLNEIQNAQVGRYSVMDEYGVKTKEKGDVVFLGNLKWHIVVISDQNIHIDQMTSNIQYAQSKEKNNDFRFYIFSKDFHPNGNGRPNVNEGDMNRFSQEIRELSL